MTKNDRKLRLNRDTLVNLDPRSVAGRLVAAIDTSCTQPCGCDTGCSAEQACLETAIA